MSEPTHIFPNANSEDVTKKTARAIIDYLMVHPNVTKKQLTPLKGSIGKKFGFQNVIKNSLISKYATEKEKTQLRHILKRRLTRTLSGVTIVAVMTHPNPAGKESCPGECIFCPGNESQPGEKVAKSYTGREPAAMRSAMYKYDAYQQTLHRLIDLSAIGHQVDKIELIIMGGTFLHLPNQYQNEFMKGCFDAIINYSLPNFNDHQRSASIEDAMNLLESSNTRLIGVTFETRPDYCRIEHVDRMLALGATRVEIGIQSTNDALLAFSHRNHTALDNIVAIKTAKDAGLKVNAHMMPNLPTSSYDMDLAVFRELFDNPLFRPDMMKIYPCLVVKGTQLYQMFLKEEYIPYPQERIVELIAQIKTELPPYVRIQRIQRDIPMDLIEAGVKNSNLRQIVQAKLASENKHCNCIRCREEGFYAHRRLMTSKPVDFSGVQFHTYPYEASDGEEWFLSFEDLEKRMLIGYLRLRFPSKDAHRNEISQFHAAIVREIRVVGEIVKHSDAPLTGQIQHRGYGKKLMAQAELIAKDHGFTKLLVIAGIGVRPYFYNLGYHRDGPYVSKML